MVNKVLIIGNLGDEVKMHYFDGGNCVGRFPVATSKHWTDKQTGEKKEKTTWHNIVVRNKVAENCEKYLSKGKKVYVEGEIQNRSYENEGREIWVTEIMAHTVQFLSPANSQPEGHRGAGAAAKPASTTKAGTGPEHAGDQFLEGAGRPTPEDYTGNIPDDEDSDLPF